MEVSTTPDFFKCCAPSRPSYPAGILHILVKPTSAFFFFKNVVSVIQVLLSSAGHNVKMDFAGPTVLTDQVPPCMAEVSVLQVYGG